MYDSVIQSFSHSVIQSFSHSVIQSFSAKRLKSLRVSIAPLLFLVSCWGWQPTSVCAQTPEEHLTALCAVFQTYMANEIPADLTKAEDPTKAAEKLGDLTVVERGLPRSYSKPEVKLNIKKVTINVKGEALYIWEPVNERAEYCKIMCIFFGLGKTNKEWERNAIPLVTALNNKETSVTIAGKMLLIKLESDDTGVLQPFSVIQEGVSVDYDKRCRLPAVKTARNTLTGRYPYLMNFEIKRGSSDPNYKTWSAWDVLCQRTPTTHKKYINIHLNFPPKP